MNAPADPMKTIAEEMLLEVGPVERVRVVDVTRAAAVAVKPWVGRGEKESADHAAVEAMRRMLNNEIMVRGTVVIGEGERDKAPMLYIGEEVGRCRHVTPAELIERGILAEVPSSMSPHDHLTREMIVDLKVLNALRKQRVPEERWMAEDELLELGYAVVDIATDPLEGTTPAAYNNEGAVTVMAMAERGTVLHAPDMYMEKLVVGSHAAGKVSILDPVELTIRKLQDALHRSSPHEINVVVMNRGRSRKLIEEVRAAGATVKLIEDGDMMRGIASTIRGSQIHALMGIGAAPEGVLTAIAVGALGGEIQARLVTRNVNHSNVREDGTLDGEGDEAAVDARNAFRFSPEERERMARMKIPGLENVLKGEKIFTTDELCSSRDTCFGATGVTNGDVLKGVRVFPGGAVTDSITIGSSGIVHSTRSIYIKDRRKTPLRMDLA
jgi:fructose-1,6-bisphosphatase II / sedoheptulose-1,7-bisphosphatase